MMVDMDKTIRPGCRVIEADDCRDPIRGDVLRVSKDGKRVQVQFWGRGLREGKLTTLWTHASMWRTT